ncbi:His/Gly/Thr/Pro-type tRNA ligase C-terminal domain-containing protein [Streptomyces sp. TG1A-8]|uniref:His/Gly/Thr/Pro-type tRNA ligase C-terminal domain-containing protein n=1 Tax=Streptomyces sp. TG1A-8 TaxID=3051385 RepID=UPI00265BDE2E|nr:His/Gly/Thr/Pro-type tRNA ligase C-terminal domain-containing protein [Streptomyces sp. TG1A-8]MDO0925016.1 His/Gly/Thr/Pro-type tRNA ligase C-terminal domain-containing protein [Streptomyces sp. TG1A-8]
MPTLRDRHTLGISVRHLVITPDGRLNTRDSEAKSGPAPAALPRHLGWIEHGSGDGPQFVWTSAGSTALNLAEQWIRRASTDRLWGDEVVTPSLYPWQDGSPLQTLAGTFADRLYFTDGARRQVLRWNADPGLFSVLSGRHVPASRLPLRLWETCRCFRLNQSGERKGVRRMDEFTLHDHHAICSDEQSALLEYERLVMAQLDLIGDWTDQAELVFTLTEDALDARTDFLARLSERTGRPLNVEVLSRRRHYWDMKHKIVTRSGYSTFNTQFDTDNARRFGLTTGSAHGPRTYPVVLHTSLSSPERLLLVAAAQASGSTPARFPLWFAPVQLRLMPVNHDSVAEAVALARRLSAAGVRTDVDDRNHTISWKVRKAAEEWTHFVAVIGPREAAGGPLAVRDRDGTTQTWHERELLEQITKEHGASPVRMGEVRLSRRATS